MSHEIPMKHNKILLTMMVLCTALTGRAQTSEYRPFLEEGKVWTYHYYNPFTSLEYYKSLTLSGDTLIEGNKYTRIVDQSTGDYECAMREAEKKVYAVFPHYSTENLIYDFSLGVGDSFRNYYSVVSVDTIVVDHQSFRCMDVRPSGDEWVNWWVEGIGSMYYLTSYSLYAGNCYSFYSCQLNGETLFTQKDYPYTVNIHNQPLTDGDASSSLYDLQGRRLMQKPAKGVYIQEGRKRVVK